VGIKLWEKGALEPCPKNLSRQFRGAMLYMADFDDHLYPHFPVGSPCAEPDYKCASYSLKKYQEAHLSYGVLVKHYRCSSDRAFDKESKGILFTAPLMSYEMGFAFAMVRKVNGEGRPLESDWFKLQDKVRAIPTKTSGQNIFLYDKIQLEKNYETAHGRWVNGITFDGGLIRTEPENPDSLRPLLEHL